MMRRDVHRFPCRTRRGGFTLLELCIVLFIIALLAGAAMPAIESAFTEQALRGDSHQLSLMVRTAMIESSEQQRPYLISLDGADLVMEPAPASVATENTTADATTTHHDADAQAVPEDVTMNRTLGNKIEFPDAQKKNAWESLLSVRWLFQPDGLCPLPRIRLQRGRAYIEMSFNALTGNVEDEDSYVP
jgi:prepilin-type N-terminal cleavage/methylation domain-containing protein